MADGQETIETLSKQFSEAFKARDFAALGSMYTNDAVLCPPNSNMITGKGNIQAFWERNRAIQNLSFDSISVKALGDNVMRAVGTLRLPLGAAGPLDRRDGGAADLRPRHLLHRPESASTRRSSSDTPVTTSVG